MKSIQITSRVLRSAKRSLPDTFEVNKLRRISTPENGEIKSVKAKTIKTKTTKSSIKTSIKTNIKEETLGDGEIKTETIKSVEVKNEGDENVLNKQNCMSYYESIKSDPVELPADFTSSHDPEFVKGLNFVLAKDPSFYKWVVMAPFKAFALDHTSIKRDDHYYFESLSSGIISQQISGKAAKLIKQRLIDNLNPEAQTFPQAQSFVDSSLESLRSFGLSMRKLEYVKLIALDFVKGILSKQVLESLDDEKVGELLIAYKGIGPWSVVMFLLFTMKRLNVFASSDLGVLRGASLYLHDRSELLALVKLNTVVKSRKKKEFKNRNWTAIDEECLDTLSREFEPFKTCLMLIFYRISDVSIEALES